MSYLINRNPSGRLICLHALLTYLYKRFENNSFTLNDLKYDALSKHNIHQTCTLLKKWPSIPFKTCPYLENALSKAKCYLTQSKQEDKQKSKSASDAFNALEGLGFIKRSSVGGNITALGKEFASIPFDSTKSLEIIKNALLNYGPFVGFLNEIIKTDGNYVSRSQIQLGYPLTNEKIKTGTSTIILSTGSTKDTITRTRSVLFIWATTGSFLLPNCLREPSDQSLWHIETLKYIESKTWSENKFKKCFSDALLKNKLYVQNPLSYKSMTKSTKALRERNQKEERELTLKYEPIIKNRRFAIVYGLNEKSLENKPLNIDKYLDKLLEHPDYFVVNKNEFATTMDKELEIASVVGIPYTRSDDLMFPLTKVNKEELTKDAPSELINLLDSLVKTS